MGRLALTATGISRAFGGVRAVQDVSLRVEAGQTVALVGPNGAGKSTLVQILSGFERIDTGTIHLGGQRIDGQRPYRIARLGVRRSFQTSRVFPALTVEESVLTGLSWQPQAGLLAGLTSGLSSMLGTFLPTPSYRRRQAAELERVHAVLALFGDKLLPRRHQPAFSLSYANRRRLDIARCLIAQPAFLLLDEPTAGMNPSESAELTDLIADLRERHPDLGWLIIEHKLNVVRRLADRVVVLNQGSVLIEDTPDAALDHPEVIEAYLGRQRDRGAFENAHHG